ncbi:hypothetical protein P3T66_09025 [Latilactobacillus sakei]|nr:MULTISPECIES: hypothetical protein [Lactobacillaceae]MDB1553639.1 hypothetical protein [Latilactobacillus sakei]WEY50220.1 hypothetical protein P3T66_09025 [Latilactobacillus sakei]SON72065.1 protein of unknown function [Latilactobacillus sakei]
MDDYRIILNQLVGDNNQRVFARQAVPYSVFIIPPLSNVGLTEKEAEKKNVPYRLYKTATADMPKIRVMNNPKGLFKALPYLFLNRI